MDIVSVLMVLAGAGFFTAGTVGLIRFPDVRSKLHALTKADNLGLGLIFGGVALRLGSWAAAGLLLLTWLLAMGAASVSAHILGGLEAREFAHSDASARSGGSAPSDGSAPSGGSVPSESSAGAVDPTGQGEAPS